MKSKHFELRERATRILGLGRIFNIDEIQQAYHRQIKLVHPDKGRQIVDGIDSLDVAKLVIQSYGFLMGKNLSTTMLEDDVLVYSLIGNITSIKETVDYGEWDLNKFYNQFENSIWANSPSLKHELKYKFGGVC